MKKRIFWISIGIFIVFIGLLSSSLIDDRKVLVNEDSTQVINTNALTMMYETEVGSGEYQVSSDTVWLQDGYTFNETLSKCENGSVLTWDSENNRVVMQANVSDKCYVYFDKATFADICKQQNSNTISCYVARLYTNDGDNGLYYHDGVGNYTNSNQEAEDKSYRYSGANPNNYVCFGTDATTCPIDNLYRIIGIFEDKIKVIKADYASTNLLGTENYVSDFNSSDYANYNGSMSLIPRFSWGEANTTSVINYDASEKNIVDNYIDVRTLRLKYETEYLINFLPPEINCSGTYYAESFLNLTSLNENFFNTFSESWQTKIATVTWNSYSSIFVSGLTAKEAYNYEIGDNKSENYMYDARIGLMYAHDYLYGAIPDNWINDSYSYDAAIDNNWLYLGVPEFLNMSVDGVGAMMQIGLSYITSTGTLNEGDSCNEGHMGSGQNFLSYAAIRPVFYINSDVIYTSGSGTQSDPFRIS